MQAEERIAIAPLDDGCDRFVHSHDDRHDDRSGERGRGRPYRPSGGPLSGGARDGDRRGGNRGQRGDNDHQRLGRRHLDRGTLRSKALDCHSMVRC
ncbi:MAG TPA: hypothetical protein VG455_16790 [Acidimicrobiales bacterium]|nr:hypothetical protein [Acidimicrobiales bacterium]